MLYNVCLAVCSFIVYIRKITNIILFCQTLGEINSGLVYLSTLDRQNKAYNFGFETWWFSYRKCHTFDAKLRHFQPETPILLMPKCGGLFLQTLGY